ncbi:positive regulator of late transcription [Halomonas campisalis]|uniref:Positive regulator of late transcription n=1 Tax=Billgrantia campisalis TaxID=74661 RepID=A0ABS9PDN4_9GAMM|nr:Mor transcription activator family protein [Halomonas campisalis]MCG6659881.1 positive regulator of late transcription [Halomonas campisalis]MDR5865081.1 Mor transcription activator family protein [Halomonas campisalis]
MSEQKREHKWPKKLMEVTDVAEQALVNHGLEQNRSRELAKVVIKALAFLHGGRVFYFPKGEGLDLALRDREIWERFDGHNHEELSREHGLTTTRIYGILAEQRKLRQSDKET